MDLNETFINASRSALDIVSEALRRTLLRLLTCSQR